MQTLLAQDPEEFRQAVDILLEQNEWTGEITKRHKNGHAIITESHWTLVKDEAGNNKSVFAISSDISARKLAEAQIRELAFYDPLTKLANRRLLMDRIEKALESARRSQTFGALIFIDLDNFKMLNDTLGHDKGDLLLQGVATRLKDSVRDCDTVARLGGDEFVVMLEELGIEQAMAANSARTLSEKILLQLNRPFELDAYLHKSTPSMGVVLFNQHSHSVSELLKQADTAMYTSKAAGRNRISFFE